MPSRYIISTTPEAIESKFALPNQSLKVENNYNISSGQFAPVITNNKPYEIQLFKFGLTPFWAKAEMNLVNARSEGDSNPDDNPTFRGAAGIILKKAFRKPIRSQRCIVIASAFIEGPSSLGLSKPYLIYLRNHQNPFAMAGIWDLAKSQNRFPRKFFQHNHNNCKQPSPSNWQSPYACNSYRQ